MGRHSVDRDTFDKLAKGMSYEEVVEQLGAEGELISDHTAQVEPGFTIGSMNTGVYEWRYPGGAAIRLLFRANQLADKSASE